MERETESLVSTERLSCDSPVMWPDQNFFGDFNPLHLSPAPPKWMLEVQRDDYRMINEFASLTHSQLMEKVRALQNLAYQLGVEEAYCDPEDMFNDCSLGIYDRAKQMSRGKCLDVFEPVTQVPSELQTKPRRSNPRRTH